MFILLGPLLCILVLTLVKTGKQAEIAMPVLNPSELTDYVDRDCDTQVIHFFSQQCPACKRAEQIISQLPQSIRRCWVGVSIYDYKPEKYKLFHAVIVDRKDRLRMDWGVRKVPTTFWINQGKIVKVKRDPVAPEDVM